MPENGPNPNEHNKGNEGNPDAPFPDSNNREQANLDPDFYLQKVKMLFGDGEWSAHSTSENSVQQKLDIGTRDVKLSEIDSEGKVSENSMREFAELNGTEENFNKYIDELIKDGISFSEFKIDEETLSVSAHVKDADGTVYTFIYLKKTKLTKPEDTPLLDQLLDDDDYENFSKPTNPTLITFLDLNSQLTKKEAMSTTSKAAMALEQNSFDKFFSGLFKPAKTEATTLEASFTNSFFSIQGQEALAPVTLRVPKVESISFLNLVPFKKRAYSSPPEAKGLLYSIEPQSQTPYVDTKINSGISLEGGFAEAEVEEADYLNKEPLDAELDFARSDVNTANTKRGKDLNAGKVIKSVESVVFRPMNKETTQPNQTQTKPETFGIEIAPANLNIDLAKTDIEKTSIPKAPLNSLVPTTTSRLTTSVSFSTIKAKSLVKKATPALEIPSLKVDVDDSPVITLKENVIALKQVETTDTHTEDYKPNISHTTNRPNTSNMTYKSYRSYTRPETIKQSVIKTTNNPEPKTNEVKEPSVITIEENSPVKIPSNKTITKIGLPSLKPTTIESTVQNHNIVEKPSEPIILKAEHPIKALKSPSLPKPEYPKEAPIIQIKEINKAKSEVSSSHDIIKTPNLAPKTEAIQKTDAPKAQLSQRIILKPISRSVLEKAPQILAIEQKPVAAKPKEIKLGEKNSKVTPAKLEFKVVKPVSKKIENPVAKEPIVRLREEIKVLDRILANKTSKLQSINRPLTPFKTSSRPLIPSNSKPIGQIRPTFLRTTADRPIRQISPLIRPVRPQHQSLRHPATLRPLPLQDRPIRPIKLASPIRPNIPSLLNTISQLKSNQAPTLNLGTNDLRKQSIIFEYRDNKLLDKLTTPKPLTFKQQLTTLENTIRRHSGYTQTPADYIEEELVKKREAITLAV